jgi:hypothetical protein
MRIDFTLDTCQGLFEVETYKSGRRIGCGHLGQGGIQFSPDIIMSPLALPRQLLDKTVDRLVNNLPAGALKDVLLQLKSRPTFAEQWPDTYQAGTCKRQESCVTIRTDPWR